MQKKISTAKATQQALNAALDAQPKWYRSKSTYINLLQGIVWIIGVVTPLLTGAPEWVSLLVGGIGTLAAAALSKLTPGEFTPSMAERAARYAPDIVTVTKNAEGAGTTNNAENGPVPTFPAVTSNDPWDDGGKRYGHDAPHLAGGGSTVAPAEPKADAESPDYSDYMKQNRG